MKLSKRGVVQFTWIFSLIIGALIIFLAVYSAAKFVQTSSFQTQAELVRQLDVVLNPFASVGAITTMTLSKQVELPVEMQLNFSCSSQGNYNELNARTRKGKGWGDWLERGFRIKDKYIFSDSLSGKNLWVFSKPFEMPWRVDDAIYILDKSYCFDNPPQNIKDEIDAMGFSQSGQGAVFLKKDSCPAGSVEVCFGSRQCAVNVNYPLGIVRKEGEGLVFAGDAMMYAAIFSGKAVYQCNFDRFIERLRTQIDMNIAESIKLKERGCDTDALLSSLQLMKSAFKEKLLGNYVSIANEVADNNPKECPVFD